MNRKIVAGVGLAVIAGVGAGLWYFIGGKSGTEPGITAAANGVAPNPATIPEAKPGTQAVALPPPGVKGQPLNTAGKDVLPAGLAARFGNDKLGKEALAAYESVAKDLVAGNITASSDNTELVKRWKANPAEGMRELKDLYGRFKGGEFPDMRTDLLRIAGDLEGQGSSARELATGELKDTKVVPAPLPAFGAAPEENPQRVLVGEAFRVAVQNTTEPKEALKLAIDTIADQQDPATRLQLIAGFLQKHPKAEDQLKAAMQARHIDDPERSVASMAADHVESMAQGAQADAEARAAQLKQNAPNDVPAPQGGSDQ